MSFNSGRLIELYISAYALLLAWLMHYYWLGLCNTIKYKHKIIIYCYNATCTNTNKHEH